MGQEIRKILFREHDPYANLELREFDPFTWEQHPEIFTDIFNTLKPTKILEIGSFLGGSARIMAKHVKAMGIDAEVVCVDTWLGSFEHWDGTAGKVHFQNGRPVLYHQFLSNVVHADLQDIITPFPIDSTNAFIFLNNIGYVPDFVYVDGAHDYASAGLDMMNAGKIVRVGGVVLVDDFHHGPIREAAATVFRNNIIDLGGKFSWIK